MIEQTVDIPTPDGACTTFVVRPDRGGPFPPVLFFMDAPGYREELRDMARRLASAGYFVVLPNLYYRAGVLELGPVSPESRPRMMALMESIDIAKVLSDADALIAWIDGQADAKPGKIGAFGYCMSGQYAISLAARHPERVAAAASLYGVRLMTDRPDSPHLAARKAKGELYFACAETDAWAPMEMVEALRKDFAANGVQAEIEIYPGTEHGFAFPQRPVYHKLSAERHWTRLHALFRRNLHGG